MSAPYLLISDTHYHDFAQFAHTTRFGINSRLEATIAATYEAAAALKAAGGHVIVHAGDAFHVRGKVAPSVLNPVMDLYRSLVSQGFEVYMIPGNHDLEKNESERVGNAVTTLESVGVKVAHAPMVVELSPDHKIALFPWFSSVSKLIAEMSDLREELVDGLIEHDAEPHLDAVIHAPIDGVLPHLPPHGLDASSLFSTGFDRVFSGHYHHHKDMGDGVYSIGALTHQTWGDIASQAGFVLVYPDGIEQRATKAPRFIDISDISDPEAQVPGNFVRVRVEFDDPNEIEELRETIGAFGPAGITINAVKRTVVTRTAAPAATTSGAVSIESSIEGFVKKRSLGERAHREAIDILREAREAVA